MKRLSTSGAVYRVFLRSMPRHTVDAQRGRAAACVELGGDVQEYHPEHLEAWYAHARSTDILICDRLEFIPPPRSKKHGPFPTNTLGEVRGFVKAHGLKLVEAFNGEVPDAKRWREAIENVAHGRRIASGFAREIGKKGGEKKPVETIQDYWKRHPDHATFKAIWRGAAGTYQDAFEAVNTEARRRKFIQISSVTMAFRAFGHRGKRK